MHECVFVVPLKSIFRNLVQESPNRTHVLMLNTMHTGMPPGLSDMQRESMYDGEAGMDEDDYDEELPEDDEDEQVCMPVLYTVCNC